MFRLKAHDDRFIHHVNDVDTLADLVLGYVSDPEESKRIAVIAGNMQMGDSLITCWCTIMRLDDGDEK